MFLLIFLLKMILTWIKVSHIMFLLLDENSMGFLSTPQNTNWCDTNLHFTMLCDISDTSPYCRITYIKLPDVSFTYLLIGKINILLNLDLTFSGRLGDWGWACYFQRVHYLWGVATSRFTTAMSTSFQP